MRVLALDAIERIGSSIMFGGERFEGLAFVAADRSPALSKLVGRVEAVLDDNRRLVPNSSLGTDARPIRLLTNLPATDAYFVAPDMLVMPLQRTDGPAIAAHLNAYATSDAVVAHELGHGMIAEAIGNPVVRPEDATGAVRHFSGRVADESLADFRAGLHTHSWQLRSGDAIIRDLESGSSVAHARNGVRLLQQAQRSPEAAVASGSLYVGIDGTAYLEGMGPHELSFALSSAYPEIQRAGGWAGAERTFAELLDRLPDRADLDLPGASHALIDATRATLGSSAEQRVARAISPELLA